MRNKKKRYGSFGIGSFMRMRFAEGDKGGGGGEASDWREDIAEEHRDAECLKDIGSVEDLAKSFINQQPLIGADKVVLPGKEATEEDMGKFFTALGRPESADKYELPTEGLPENVSVGEADQKEIKDLAFGLGLNSKQTAQLYRAYASRMGTGQAALDKTGSDFAIESEATLKKEFGQAYDEKVSLAKSAVLEFGGEALKKALNETGLGNHPDMIRAFAKIGKAIASDEILGEGSKRNFVKSPTEAQAELDALTTDKDFNQAYLDGAHPGHAAAVQKKQDLYQAVHIQQE